MIQVEIFQKPTPEKQTKRGKGHFYNPNEVEKQQIIWQINPHAPKEPLRGAIELDIAFYLPIPKGSSKIQRAKMINGEIMPIKRPDIDNLAYLITNAMKHIMYEDDSQIVDMMLRKRYGEIPKTVVKIIEL